ncbi:hypothetical protein R3P38DRAFT_3013853 [Favolaschia claudopus]|uniref:Uncharacterized protein n=1 Tax=Favolaschia claudopus TaxID=2862362 RepID=A0AAW0AJ08_9AGAR
MKSRQFSSKTGNKFFTIILRGHCKILVLTTHLALALSKFAQAYDREVSCLTALVTQSVKGRIQGQIRRTPLCQPLFATARPNPLAHSKPEMDNQNNGSKHFREPRVAAAIWLLDKLYKGRLSSLQLILSPTLHLLERLSPQFTMSGYSHFNTGFSQGGYGQSYSNNASWSHGGQRSNADFYASQGFPGGNLAAQQNYYVHSHSQSHIMPPPPPRPLLAPTQIDSRPADYWHNKQAPPHHQSRYAQSHYMVAGNDILNEFMPPHTMRYAEAEFLIEWPGYRPASYTFTLVDPNTRRHITRAMLGAQATQLFKNFANTRKDAQFMEVDGSMRLGVDGVMYDQVRLVELYTNDGKTFRAQWALNAHYLSVGM